MLFVTNLLQSNWGQSTKIEKLIVVFGLIHLTVAVEIESIRSCFLFLLVFKGNFIEN